MKMKRGRTRKKIRVVTSYFPLPIPEKDEVIVVFKKGETKRRSTRCRKSPKLEVTSATDLESNANSLISDNVSAGSRSNLMVGGSSGKEGRKRRSNRIIGEEKNSYCFDNAFHVETIDNDGEDCCDCTNQSQVKKRMTKEPLSFQQDLNYGLKEEKRDEKVPHFFISRGTSGEIGSERTTSSEKTSFKDLMSQYEYKGNGMKKSIGKLGVCTSHFDWGVRKDSDCFNNAFNVETKDDEDEGERDCGNHCEVKMRMRKDPLCTWQDLNTGVKRENMDEKVSNFVISGGTSGENGSERATSSEKTSFEDLISQYEYKGNDMKKSIGKLRVSTSHFDRGVRKDSDYFDNAFHLKIKDEEGEGEGEGEREVKKRLRKDSLSSLQDLNSGVKEEKRDEKMPHFFMSRGTSGENGSERATSSEKTSFKDLMSQYDFKGNGMKKLIGKQRVCTSHFHMGVRKDSDCFDNAFHVETKDNEGEGEGEKRLRRDSLSSRQDLNSGVKEEKRDEKVPHFFMSRGASGENGSERATSSEKTSFEDLMSQYEFKGNVMKKSIGKLQVCTSNIHSSIKKEEGNSNCKGDKIAAVKEFNYSQKSTACIRERAESNLRQRNAGCKNFQRFIKTTLSASQKKDEAYIRKTSENTWKPPRSKFGLLQEDHAHDPWRVMLICILLNCTTGVQVGRVLGDLFTLCPNAQAATEVETAEIEQLIRGLGLQKKRAVMIQRFSREYMEEGWTHVTQLHGIGKYAADAHAIFCTGKWDRVTPTDVGASFGVLRFMLKLGFLSL